MLWCRLAFFAAATMLVSAAHAQTTITFRFNDPEAPQMRQALDEFEKANPDIKVTLQRVSWSEAQQQYLREAAVGSAPDVAQFAFGWPRPFSAAGALRPLDDLIQKTGIGVAGWDQFIAKDLAFGEDGKIYGVPFTTDTWAMLYNKDLLKAAGYDKFPTTWADLRAASKAIMEKTGKTGYGFPAGTCGSPTMWFLTNYYIWSKGWAFVDQQPNGGKYFVAVTPDQIAEAFDYYDSYLKQGHNPKVNLSVCCGSPEIVEGMVSGQAAIASVRTRSASRSSTPSSSASRQAGPVRRRASSGRRQRIEDPPRRPHAQHQPEQQISRAGLEADPIPDDTGADIYQALLELCPGPANAHELRTIAARDRSRFHGSDQDCAKLGTLRPRSGEHPIHVERGGAGRGLCLHRREDDEAGGCRSSRSNLQRARQKSKVEAARVGVTSAQPDAYRRGREQPRMKGDRRFVASMLLPTFFFLICFYAYPTLYNAMNSFTDLSLFGMRKGGAWVGFENYWELVTSRDFRSVLWNTIVWLTIIGVSVRILLGLALAFLLTSRTIRKYRLQTISRVLLRVPWATRRSSPS